MRELYKNTRFVLGHKTTPEVVLWASHKALPNVSYISKVFLEVWWTTEKVNDKDDYNAVVHHNDHLSYLPHFLPSQPHKYCPHSTFSSPLHHYTAPFPVECPQEKGSLWRLSSAWVSMDPRVNTSAQHHSEAVCSMHYWPTLLQFVTDESITMGGFSISFEQNMAGEVWSLSIFLGFLLINVFT